MRRLWTFSDFLRPLVIFLTLLPAITIGVIRVMAAPETNVPAQPNLGNWTTPCVTAASIRAAVGIDLASARPDYAGVAMNGDPLLIYVAPNESFGVLVNVSPGIYCILATGDHWTNHQ